MSGRCCTFPAETELEGWHQAVEKAAVIPTTTETVIFDLMQKADTDEFRAISKILN